MRVVAGVAAALALTACSSEPAPQPQPQPAAEPVAAPVTATRAVGSGLTGSISGLAADTSALSVRVTDTATIVALPADTLFEFDSAALSPAATANLQKLADLIRKGAPGPVGITGHTDAKGDDSYNRRLSEQRAQAVADWMAGQAGVRQRSFTVEGRGEADPIAPNTTADGSDNPAGRAGNRRVEVAIPR